MVTVLFLISDENYTKQLTQNFDLFSTFHKALTFKPKGQLIGEIQFVC